MKKLYKVMVQFEYVLYSEEGRENIEASETASDAFRDLSTYDVIESIEPYEGGIFGWDDDSIPYGQCHDAPIGVLKAINA